MDKASASGAGDFRFESWAGHSPKGSPGQVHGWFVERSMLSTDVLGGSRPALVRSALGLMAWGFGFEARGRGSILGERATRPLHVCFNASTWPKPQGTSSLHAKEACSIANT